MLMDIIPECKFMCEKYMIYSHVLNIQVLNFMIMCKHNILT